MKINSPDLQNTGGIQSKKSSRVADTKKSRPTGGSDSKPVVSGGDRVAISGASQQMKTFRTSLSSIPDVRAEKVESIKSDIESGHYNPPAELIADAMMQSVQKYA
ncbi:MAG: hypothetical protein ACD_73C00297G0001 [uncultured bacterium]|nr:MAG: hypothetical protein ACD_73C00297G0001 [uncultured bacterium]